MNTEEGTKMTDLVGASEAAKLLDVEVQRISRYRAEGKMPDPVATLASTPVWNKSDVLAMAKGRQSQHSPIPLAGTSEAANLIGVKKSQISRWLRHGEFPVPVVRLAAGPVWEAEQIEEFAESRLWWQQEPAAQ